MNVIDETDPVVQCPSEVTVELDGNCELVLEDYTGQVLVTELARTLSDDPVMERLRLIELLSVLRSILISVSIFFRCPASAIP